MFSTSDRRDEGQCRRRRLTSVKWRKAVEQAMVPFIAMRVTALLDVRRLHWLPRHRHCGREIEYTLFTLINVGAGLTRGREEEELLQLKTQCLLWSRLGRK